MKPADYLSSKAISVREDGSKWMITGKLHTVVLDSADFGMTVESGTSKWNMLPANEMDLTVAHGGESFSLSLMDAGKIDISRYDTGAATGLKVELGGFKHNGNDLDFEMQLIVALDGTNEDLVFSIVPKESATVIEKCRWPKAFNPEENNFTVVPFMQGMLLPNDWPKKAWLHEPSTCYGRGLGMPWWGHQKGNSSVLVIFETPDDVGCNFTHPAGGPTFIESKWVHSLGRMNYVRQLRMCFIDNGSYVDMAKRYRQYVKDKGRLVSLEEKMARKPLLEKLIGSPVFHTDFIAWHCNPKSYYYVKDDPAANDRTHNFIDRTEEIKSIAAQGIKRLYIHQDGWGYRGYDNQHPDILPPSPEAGGWDGMRKYADVCDELGFVYAIHDNYRDYYLDAASYDPDRSITNEDGSHPYEATWTGGPQSILCTSFSPAYVTRNHSEILRHGIKLKGAYLDVFSIVPGDECYDPNHPMSRADCLKYRAECFDFVSSRVGMVSSEEPTDWAIPHLDLVHHAPYAEDHPGPGEGPTMGIPIPLISMVYHDSIFIPWPKGKEPKGYLQCMLQAGLPYISPDLPEEQLSRVRMACGLNKRVGLLEMIKHEYLDSNRRRQKTTFADGTTVIVDFDTDTVEITPELTKEELDWVMTEQ
ncbi:MAG: DUF5696 domain-containing protein [Armatimonadota bacterium]